MKNIPSNHYLAIKNTLNDLVDKVKVTLFFPNLHMMHTRTELRTETRNHSVCFQTRITCWILALRTAKEGADLIDVSLSTNEGDLRLMAVCVCF